MLWTLATLPITAAALSFYFLFIVPVVWAFNLLIVAVLLLAGARGINYEAIRRPWKTAPNTIWQRIRPRSRWTHKEIASGVSNYDGQAIYQYEERPKVFAVLNIGVITLVTLLCISVYSLQGTGMLVAVIVAFILVVLGTIAYDQLTKETPEKTAARLRAEQEQHDLEQRRLMAALNAVSCPADEDQPSDQPRRPLTFVVLYDRAKQFVGCRPFER